MVIFLLSATPNVYTVSQYLPYFHRLTEMSLVYLIRKTSPTSMVFLVSELLSCWKCDCSSIEIAFIEAIGGFYIANFNENIYIIFLLNWSSPLVILFPTWHSFHFCCRKNFPSWLSSLSDTFTGYSSLPSPSLARVLSLGLYSSNLRVVSEQYHPHSVLYLCSNTLPPPNTHILSL